MTADPTDAIQTALDSLSSFAEETGPAYDALDQIRADREDANLIKAEAALTDAVEKTRVKDKTAMDRWVEEFADRDDIAKEYTRLLNTKAVAWGGWPVLNLAIIDRWSVSGLEYIKQKAWRG